MMGFILAALLTQSDPPPLQKADVDRPVADIISPIWSDPAHRDAAHEVDQIVARLHLRAGARVADIGAGSGYDTLRLAKVVGPRGRILAEDITPAYLRQLRQTVSAAGLGNIDIIEGEPGDPKLPPRSIDAAIMVHMYHEIQQPLAMLAKLAPAFKPGGRLGIEELDRPTQAHGTPPKLLACELAAAGYRLTELKPLQGDIGYFAVFSPPGAVMPQAASAARRCRG
jgi:SAM-dependent methyltransferase